MGIFLGDTAPSKIFVWGSQVASVWAWDVKVRPAWPTVDFLLIGWWGQWGWNYSTDKPWAWGWAWGFIECFWYSLDDKSYSIVIWCWGNDNNIASQAQACGRWCPSCFWSIVSYWWGVGSWANTCNTWANKCYRDGASWWGGITSCWPWCACYWNQWNWWWTWAYAASGGWGWAGAAGCNWNGSSTKWWDGGAGKCSCMSWTLRRYSWGWGGSTYHNTYACRGCWWCWWGWDGGTRCTAACNATYYWGGWWWGTNRSARPWVWCKWIFILRYPAACWYSISWWTKTTATVWGVSYCIHTFTSNGTLTVS